MGGERWILDLATWLLIRRTRCPAAAWRLVRSFQSWPMPGYTNIPEPFIYVICRVFQDQVNSSTHRPRNTDFTRITCNSRPSDTMDKRRTGMLINKQSSSFLLVENG